MLLRLTAVLMLNVIALGIALPVLPALALAVGGTAVDIGFLYGIQSLGQLLTAPLWGGLSDRIGRKRVIVIVMVLLAIAELTTAFCTSLWALYLSRFFVGCVAAMVPLATAFIADITEESRRSRGMAVVGVSFGVGFTIGPAIGAIIGYFTIAGPGLLGKGLAFAVTAGLALFAAGLAAIILKEPDVDVDVRRSHRRSVDLAAVRDVLRSAGARSMCGLFLFYTLAASVMEGTFFVFMEGRYGYSEREVGVIFAGLGILLAITQGGVHPLSKRFGDRKLVIVGGILVGVGLIAAPPFWALAGLLIALAISTMGRAFIHPAILSLTSKLPEAQSEGGRVMGVLQSSSSLGRIIGPAVGGLVFTWNPDAPFYAAGAIMLLSLAWWARSRPK